MDKTYAPVTTAQELTEALAKCRAAQEKFATYTQEQVDKIFLAAATAANRMRIPLAKQAVAETGMGVVEDKVIKNHYAAEYIYNAYKDSKTCGVIEEDTAYGIQRIAEPIGVIAAVIPTTNPTSTAIFKTLISLKTRNGIIISPHPRAKGCTIAAARVVLGELSDGALRVCRQNIRRTGLSGQAVSMQLNALEKAPKRLGEFDCIVSNPPYIPDGDIAGLDPSVRDYEPHLALKGGVDGLDFYRAICDGWREALRPGGRLYFEVGIGQADDVLRIMRAVGFGDIEVLPDLNGIPRVVWGILHTEL